MAFRIVEFFNMTPVEVEMIIEEWLTDGGCMWPPCRASQVKKLMMTREKPKDNWIFYACREIAQASTYESARRKLLNAELTSDLASDLNSDVGMEGLPRPKRRKKINRRYVSESDSDECEEAVATSDNISELELPPEPFLSQNRTVENVTSFAAVAPHVPASPTPSHATPSPHSTNTHHASPRIYNKDLLSPTTRAPLTPQRLSARDTESRSRVTRNIELQPTSVSSLKAYAVSPYERALVGVLETMSEQLRHVSSVVAQIHSHLAVQNTSTELPENINLPISSLEELREADNLMADQRMKKLLINHLASIGGGHIGDTVRRIMAKLITNGLAKNCNWVGKGGKIAFSGLRLRAVVLGAVRKAPFVGQVTDKEIEDQMKLWLKFAKDRDGGRKEREERKNRTLLHTDIDNN